ncbi:MAG TPA: hypothetical protein VNB29_10910, partial [Chthoniobacterales bacterium]|nr:hypothetical protein [Chthoniobacterales bacterium]
MSDSPEIEWLRRKWNLPESGAVAVEHLLAEEAAGSTACVLEEPLPEWGDAALEPDAKGHSPLVLIRHAGKCFLQSRRFQETESRIAHRLLSMSEEVFAGNESESRLKTLFPGAGDDDR